MKNLVICPRKNLDMFKIVITDPDLFMKLKTISGLSRIISLRMTSANLLHEPYFSEYLSAMNVTGNVYKITNEKRFADLDEMTLEVLGSNSKHEIHDVAVSSGVTSFELCEKLSSANIDFHMDVSDKYSELFSTGSSICRIHDVEGNFVEGYVLCVLANCRIGWKAFITKLLGYLLKAIPHGKKQRSVFLYDRRLYDLENMGVVEFVKYDLFKTELREKYTFVRCMNILNKINFCEEMLEVAVKLLKCSLKSGGVLLVGRTEEGTENNMASFFRKTEAGMQVVCEAGGGSEIKNIVMHAG